MSWSAFFSLTRSLDRSLSLSICLSTYLLYLFDTLNPEKLLKIAQFKMALDILHSRNALFHTNAIIDDSRQGHTI